MKRRTFTRALMTGAAALPFSGILPSFQGKARASGQAKRVIVFYFPDGVAAHNGIWRAQNQGGQIALSEQLAPLQNLVSDCTFINGLTMGPDEDGSHPGGAKKLLTGVDRGQGESVDRFLSRTAGSSSAHPMIYLGAQATINNASGDKHISYPSPGITTAPEDDPYRAFQRLFNADGTPPSETASGNSRRLRLVDTARADLESLYGRLGAADKTRADLHFQALDEVERRLETPVAPPSASCEDPSWPQEGGGNLWEPARFPAILRAQIDLTVQAMACGLTRVGVIQGSHHTSDLLMSRFESTEVYAPQSDMRSHQASHYGVDQSSANVLYSSYVKQRRFWVSQFAYLLEQLKALPEDGGTMLDHSLVLLCSEVSDGNAHSHKDMPFVLAGRAGGLVTPGRVLDVEGRAHGELLLALCHAMGQGIGQFGQSGYEPLPGLLA